MEETWLLGVCLKNEQKQAERVDLGQSRVAEGWHGVELMACLPSPRGSDRRDCTLTMTSMLLYYTLYIIYFLSQTLSPTQGMSPE